MTTSTPTPDGDDSHHPSPATRRAVLGLLGLGGLGAFAGPAGAQPPPDRGRGSGGPVYDWRRDVEANGHALGALGSLSTARNPTPIADFAGSNLAIDDHGVLNATVEAPATSWADGDEDGLLETAADGIEVGTVETRTLAVEHVGVSVYLDRPTTLPESTATRIPFDTSRFDHRGEFVPTDHRLVVAEDGHYQVTASVSIGRPSGGGDPIDGQLRLLVNGGLVGLDDRHQSNDYFGVNPLFTRLLPLAAGDTVEAQAFVNNQLDREDWYSINADADGRYTVLTMHRVG